MGIENSLVYIPLLLTIIADIVLLILFIILKVIIVMFSFYRHLFFNTGGQCLFFIPHAVCPKLFIDSLLSCFFIR